MVKHVSQSGKIGKAKGAAQSLCHFAITGIGIDFLCHHNAAKAESLVK